MLFSRKKTIKGQIMDKNIMQQYKKITKLFEDLILNLNMCKLHFYAYVIKETYLSYVSEVEQKRKSNNVN